MLQRHDIIYFYEIDNPEDLARIWPVEKGRYVLQSEAQEKIDFLREALLNLKAGDMRRNTAEQLNSYVDSVLRECK